MDMKTFVEAKSLIALISSANHNLKAWENLFESTQITCTSDTKTNPIYLTGTMKKEVESVIVNHYQEKIKEHEDKFAKL